MIEIGLGVLIGIAVGIVLARDLGMFTSRPGFLLALFLGFLLCGAFAGAGLGVAAIVSPLAPREWVFYSKTSLVALSDYNGVNGRFYINTGYVNSALQYNFYESLGGNAYAGETLSSNDSVTIYEDEQNDPYIYQFNEQLKGCAWLWAIDDHVYLPIYELHIPKGSISGGCNLSLGSKP